jgi:hypothetical protein
MDFASLNYDYTDFMMDYDFKNSTQPERLPKTIRYCSNHANHLICGFTVQDARNRRNALCLPAIMLYPLGYLPESENYQRVSAFLLYLPPTTGIINLSTPDYQSQITESLLN